MFSIVFKTPIHRSPSYISADTSKTPDTKACKRIAIPKQNTKST